MAKALLLAQGLGGHQVRSPSKSKWRCQVAFHSLCTVIRLLLGTDSLIVLVSSHAMNQLLLPVAQTRIRLHLRALLPLMKGFLTLSCVGFL